MPPQYKYYTRIKGYERYQYPDPLQGLFDAWLDKRRGIIKDISIEAYKDSLQDIIAFFEGRPLAEITQKEADKVVGYLLNERKLNGNTVRKKLFRLKCVLNWALATELIAVLPFSFKRLPRVAAVKINKVPFTYPQYRQVQEELRREHCHPMWPDACAFAWHTGLRMSDVALMKRSLVNLDKGVILSKTQKKSRENEMLEVPIEPELRPVIERLLVEPTSHPTDFLNPRLEFCYINERPTLIQQFRNACDAIGLKSHSFHSFRHGFVTRLLNAGVDSIIISSITGQTIEQIQEYAHVTLQAKFAALARSRGEQPVKVVEVEL